MDNDNAGLIYKENENGLRVPHSEILEEKISQYIFDEINRLVINLGQAGVPVSLIRITYDVTYSDCNVTNNMSDVVITI